MKPTRNVWQIREDIAKWQEGHGKPEIRIQEASKLLEDSSNEMEKLRQELVIHWDVKNLVRKQG